MATPPTRLAPAAASVSLGAPGTHKIEPILEAAAHSGLRGIEMFYGHLAHHAAVLAKTNIDDVDQAALLKAAKDIRRMCDEQDLAIITLQPFAHYDGTLDQQKHQELVHKFALWIDLAHILRCSIVQVPSNMTKTGTTGDLEKVVADIVELADLASKADPVINIAYESMAWGAHNNLWEHSWEVIKKADRFNVGLCLDTYHVGAKVWADPCSSTGKTPNADADLAESLSRLVREVDVGKVFYLQLSDVERLESPLVEGHEFYNPEQPPHMSWSRKARLFPCEEKHGGYMPVLDIARAIVNDLGYREWVSMEIFSRHLAKDDAKVPEIYAERAMASFEKVYDRLGWSKI